MIRRHERRFRHLFKGFSTLNWKEDRITGIYDYMRSNKFLTGGNWFEKKWQLNFWHFDFHGTFLVNCKIIRNKKSSFKYKSILCRKNMQKWWILRNRAYRIPTRGLNCLRHTFVASYVEFSPVESLSLGDCYTKFIPRLYSWLFRPSFTSISFIKYAGSDKCQKLRKSGNIHGFDYFALI